MPKPVRNAKITKGKEVNNSYGMPGGIGYSFGSNAPMPNGLSGVFDNFGYGTNKLSIPAEFAANTTYSLISLQRIMLSYAYVTYGPIRTLVDQPVYDAFRGGFKVETEEVSPDELEDLNKEMRKLKLQRKVVDALRWDRLFGGAGIIINTDQDFTKEFKVQSITEESPLDFIVADRWELLWQGIPGAKTSTMAYYPGSGYYSDEDFNWQEPGRFNIGKIHPSRVARIISEKAPSLIRQRLQGWGMSIVEPVVREMNQYLKHENVVFEFLDEAKIDVYKIKHFNAQVLNAIAKGQTTKRLQLMNWMKNFMNAITLDAEDDYVQKQVSFAGIPEIMEQIRIGVAAAIRMPMAKIFGLSAKGFASGEDDLENYAAIVEGQRERAEDVFDLIIPCVMMKVWGFIPDDWTIKWKPVRTLTAEQTELVANSQFQRSLQMYDKGLLNGQEFFADLKQREIFIMDTEVSQGAEPQPPAGMMAEEEFSAAEKPNKGATAKVPKEKEG